MLKPRLNQAGVDALIYQVTAITETFDVATIIDSVEKIAGIAADNGLAQYVVNHSIYKKGTFQSYKAGTVTLSMPEHFIN